MVPLRVAPIGGAIVLPTAAQAQTVCTPGLGGLVECVDGTTPTATGTVNAGTIVASGPGLVAASGGDLVAAVDGAIATAGTGAPALSLSSLNDLTLDFIGSAVTTGANSSGIVLNALGDLDATVDDILTTAIGSDAAGRDRARRP